MSLRPKPLCTNDIWAHTWKERTSWENNLSDCPKQKDSKYKELKSSDQPVRASVVEFLEVDLSLGKGGNDRMVLL